jgi:colanic acid biosynthesis glycosyl transferase WcaI
LNGRLKCYMSLLAIRRLKIPNQARSSGRPKLWIVTELYYPEETSTGHHMTKIAEGLTADFDVGVICGQPNYFHRGTRAPASEIHNRVKIRRVPATRLNKDIILYRIVNMLTLGLSVLYAALISFSRGDQVLVVTTPPNLPFASAFASLVRSAQYTLLIHDTYPQALIAAGKAKPGSALVRFWKICNRWLFKYAAKVIVLGRDMKELAETDMEGLDVPVVSISNWAELDLIKPEDRSKNRLLQDLGLERKFVFLYAGNMGYTNDLESLIFCAEHFSRHSSIHFLFLGAGAKKKWLCNEVASKSLSNVTVLDSRPRSEQPDFLNACDVAVVTLVKGMFGVSVPSRIYNAIAAGKPLLGIADSGSELARLIVENKIGWFVQSDDRHGLINTIEAIINNRDDLKLMSKRARDLAETNYSLERAILEYKQQMLGTSNVKY